MLRARLARRLQPSRDDAAHAERGFSLIELLITVSLLLTVGVVILQTLSSVQQSQAYQADRSQSLDSMRIVLNRMTKELRQATSVDDTVSTASHLKFTTYVNGSLATIVYDASGTSLTRSLNGGTAIVVQNGLKSTDLFTYTEAPPVPGAQWVRIILQVKPQRDPETTLVLDSEVNLRNRVQS